MIVLLGLPIECRGFVSALDAHKTKPSFDQLRPPLLQEEIEMQRHWSHTTFLFGDSSALYANCGRGTRRGKNNISRGGRGQEGGHHP